MKIDTSSPEFRSLTIALIARTVAFCTINNTWSTAEKIDGVVHNFGDWFGDEVEKLEQMEHNWWQKALDKIKATF